MCLKWVRSIHPSPGLPLTTVLQIFKSVTLQFSSDTPCLMASILTMDWMHEELTTVLENEEYSPALWGTLMMGTRLLNKYYLLTDQSEVYHVAISMWLVSVSYMILIYFVSSPSKIQTQVLQETGMETSLDRNCEDHCERGIQDLICQLCCSQSVAFLWLVHKHGMF